MVRGWSLFISVITLWPFWEGIASMRAHPSRAYLLRDMFVPYNVAPNSNTLGTIEAPPRAVPQDAVLALLSPAIPGTLLAGLVTVTAALLGSAFAAGMARNMAGAALPAQLAVALFVPWNPFVIERLLQGQWTVATAGMLLPAVAYLAAAGRHARGLLFLLICSCSLTPTGAIFAAVTVAVFSPSTRARLMNLFACALAASPWILHALWSAFAASGADEAQMAGTFTDPASASAFAARAEESVGTLGALMGLGGIWNAEAVPHSRGTFATVAGVILCLLLFLGFKELWRVYQPAAIVTVAAIALPAVFATAPGIAAMEWLLAHVPGFGLFRDTSKFVALAIPGYVLLMATVTQQFSRSNRPVTFGRLTPRFLSTVMAGIFAGLAVATVPAYPAEMKPLKPVALSAAWDQIHNAVACAPAGKTLLLPPGSYRDRDGRPAISPALKLLPGSPIDPGFLVVDGKVVDGDAATIALLKDLLAGENTLRTSGVSWVLVDWESVQDPADMSGAMEVLNSPGIHESVALDGYTLYRVNNPELVDHVPSLLQKAPTLLGLMLYWIVSSAGLALWAQSTARTFIHQAHARPRPTPRP